MKPEILKYLKIAGYVVGGTIVVYGGYRGGKFLLDKFKPGETGGKDETITLADGSTVTVSAEMAKKPDATDKQNMKDSMAKWITAGKLNNAVRDKIIDNAHKSTKFEFQRLMYYFDKGNPGIANYGLTQDETIKMIALINGFKAK